MLMEEEVKRAVEFLNTGKIILYPTDTIWGIGCDATNQRAIDRIYKLKKRRESKSMIIILHSTDQLPEYMKKVPVIALDLIRSIQTPLTIIYPQARNLAKNIIAEDGTIAIRIVRHEFCQRMLREFGKPVVSTSANLSGEPPAVVFSRISREITDNVDYIVGLDRENVQLAKPSTIIKIEDFGGFTIIRN